jgi:DNA invertase Pin-like site-specific DNA recombinase
MGETLGYARVSTTHQTLDRQTDELHKHGITKVFSDKISGTKEARPGLDALLDYAREGDSVTVVSLDRLGRSTAHVLASLKLLGDRGIAVRSLKEGMDLGTAQGRFMAHVFIAFAELELAVQRERAADARAAAERRGKAVGRPKALSDEQRALAIALHAAGHSFTEIGNTLGVSRATAYRATV